MLTVPMWIQSDLAFSITPFSFELLQEVVPKRMLQMEEAIQKRDFASFAQLTCADSNQFHAVCLDTSPPIFYMNDTSHKQVPFHIFIYRGARLSS